MIKTSKSTEENMFHTKILKKLEEHDDQFKSIDLQLKKHSERFEAIDRKFEAIDRKFEAIDRKFEAIDSRFEAMDRRFDKIEENMATKSDIERIMTSLDYVVSAIKRLDEERISTIGWLQRHDHDISQIKFKLNMV